MTKKALVVVSFGTTYPAARRAIEQIETRLREQFADYDFYRAFTSDMVRRKIEREEGLCIPNPSALLARLADEGYDEALCQSLHVIPGIEYEKLLRQLAPYQTRFAALRLGKPLLFGEADYRDLCAGLLETLPPLAADEAYVYMGHGTEHFANAAYSQVENMFRALGAERAYVGTVEGFPGLDYVRGRLQKQGVRRVTLAPLMIVAGDHAQNDLAGDEDSWKTALEADGLSVSADLRGLGELDAVREIFLRHCKDAAEV